MVERVEMTESNIRHEFSMMRHAWAYMWRELRRLAASYILLRLGRLIPGEDTNTHLALIALFEAMLEDCEPKWDEQRKTLERSIGKPPNL